MAIYLVQHGISLSKSDDPEKGLSDRGEQDTLRIAQVAEQYAIRVSKICHSPKKRARETALIFKGVLAPETSLGPIDGIRPMDDVRAFASGLSSDSGHMIVGHLPFMERLTSYLTAGREEPKVLKFQNSGIVCLDKDGGGWFIKWTLNPDIS